jgi:hypothetical protein
MAIKATGVGERYGLPGLTIVLMLLAVWIGTRNSDKFGDVRSPVWQHLIALAFIAGAFWLGVENPELFDGVPVLGKLMK